MKKVFFLIMLLSLCIISVGCGGGSSNSYNGTSVETLTIKVANEIINPPQQAQASTRAAVAMSDVKLFFNGVEFPGHSMSDGDYLFTKMMYRKQAEEMTSGTTSSTVLITFAKKDLKEIKIIFQKVSMPSNMVIKLESGKVTIKNNDKTGIEVYEVNGEEYVEDYKDNISSVIITKLDNHNAKINFYNVLGESKMLSYDEWKISAYSSYKSESDNEFLKDWTSTEENMNKNLVITPNDTGKYYLISLTSDGESAAGTHNLSNTYIKIDYIRKDKKDVVGTGVLEAGYYDPTN